MELNNKERIIKRVLEESRFSLDTDVLWNEVDQELNGKKRKKRIIWFLFFGLFVISFSIHNVISTKHSYQSNISDSIVSEYINTEDNQVFDGFEEKPLTSIVKNSTDFTNKSFDTNSKIKEQHLNQTIDAKLEDEIIFIPNRRTISKINIDRISRLKIESLPHTTTGNLHFSFVGFHENYSNAQKIGAISLTSFDWERSKMVFNESSFTSIINRKTRIEFMIGSGVWMSTNQYKLNRNLDNLDLDVINTESAMPTISFTGGIRKSFNRWSLLGGINYSSIVNRYSNRYSEIINEVQNGIEYIYTNAENESIEIPGSIERTIINQHSDKLFRQHHQVDGFLGLSYQLISKGKLRLSPQLSAMRKIYAFHSGYYFTDEETTIGQIDEGVNPYNGLNFSTALGIIFEYSLGKVSFGLQPTYRYYFNALSDNNLYQINNAQYGIQLNLFYKP